MTKAELATAILTKKLTPNSLLVDDSLVDDHSTISLSAAKMEELGLFNGDTVLLKGKKRKNTVASSAFVICKVGYKVAQVQSLKEVIYRRLCTGK